MVNGVESKSVKYFRPQKAPKYPDLGRMQNFHAVVIGNGSRNTRSPCSLFQSLNQGVRFCKQFYDKGVDNCWQFVKERKLCFCCLASDHRKKRLQKSLQM